MVALSILAALGLAAVHLFSQALRLLQDVSRNRLVSIVGGMAVAFVILRLLPAIAQHQETLAEAAEGTVFHFLENHVWVLVLISIVIFYGLERLARDSRQRQRAEGKPDRTSHEVFWLHMATFALMNLLVGYLLFHHVEQQAGVTTLLLFFLAMLFKFTVNDHGLHQHHKQLYDHIGRWLLAAAVAIGWGINYLVAVPQVGPALLQAFIAGGVLLNVLKEELPEAAEGKYRAFTIGALGYAILLVTF